MSSSDHSDPDHGFISRVVAHCLGENEINSADKGSNSFGHTFTIWDGLNGFAKSDGRPQELARAADGSCISTVENSKLKRVAAVINEMESLGNQRPLRLDMHDARQYGVSDATAINKPIITYCRRRDAKNLILWPLPGYHTPGLRKFVHHTPIDKLAFEQKSDVARWRGNLSGRPNKALAPDLPERRFATAIMLQIAKENSAEKLNKLRAELMGITRYNIAVRFNGSTLVDASLTIPERHKLARQSPLLAPYSRPRVRLKWFFESKYILSFSGTDTGSNFLMAANSNSVVLKEEDGWHLFYTGEFQPWVHYIPLNSGATDLEQKLAWAKANQSACKEMSRAARRVCAKLASEVNRKLILQQILDGLYNPR